ncbi:MAG: hypothetical protein GY757_58805 [bacterium]|nr:hypothetical protein [bacterium]
MGKKVVRYLIHVASILFLFTVSFTQTLPIRNFSQNNGLADSFVYCICQDSKGFLWFGTEHGLSRFDGSVSTNFGKKDGLPDANIMAVMEDSKGRIWIGTYRGASCFTAGEFTNYTTNEGLANNYVWSIAEGHHGEIWFGTDNGLSCFDGQIFKTYTTKDGLKSNSITDISIDGDGNPWLATKGGIAYFENEHFTTYTTKDGLLHDRVRVLQPDSKGRLWIGTIKGLNCLYKGAFSSYTTEDGLSNDHVRAIFEDDGGRIWIGTWHGVSILSGKSFTNYTTKNGLIGNFVTSILKDGEGNVWIGTTSGSSCIRTTNLRNYSKKDGLPDNMVTSILEASDGTVWFGTVDGLSSYSKGEFVNYTTRDGLSGIIVNDLMQDRQGDIWIPTVEGLSIFSSGAFKSYTMEDGLPSNVLFTVTEARDGTIWIGSAIGMTRYTNGRFSPPPFSIASIGINCIMEDRKGNLWFSSDTDLFKFSKDKLTCLTSSNLKGASRKGLPEDVITKLFEDRQGRVWICTKDGLSCYCNGSFTTYSVDEGLPDNACNFILEDKQGNLWICTTNGLSYFDGKNFKTYTSGKHGLISNSFITGLVDRQGALWFGSNSGVTTFKPPPVGTNTVPPPVFLTSLKVLEKDVPISQFGRLAYDENYLRFGFAGICLTAPESVVYKYRLEGINKNWLETHERWVSYPYLPPGSYRFMVKAINNDGIESEAPRELVFEIIPPFWKTWWFLSILIFTCLAIISLFGYLKIKRTREKMELEVKKMALEVKEMAIESKSRQLVMSQRIELMGMLATGAVHDLKNMMGIILGYSNMLGKVYDPEDENYRKISLIKNTADKAVQIVRHILAFSRQKHDVTVASELGTLITDLLELLQVITPPEAKIIWERPKEKILLYINPTRFQQVVMNLCINAVHAMPDGGELTITLERIAENRLLLKVSDTGTGMQPETVAKIFDPLYTTKEQGKGTGLGLFVVKQIVDECNGEIEIQSEPEKGTVFSLTFPVAGGSLNTK